MLYAGICCVPEAVRVGMDSDEALAFEAGDSCGSADYCRGRLARVRLPDGSLQSDGHASHSTAQRESSYRKGSSPLLVHVVEENSLQTQRRH